MLQNRLLVCVFGYRGMRTRRRGYHGGTASLCIWVCRTLPALTCLFDPEFTPALRTDLAVDQRAGVWLLEERAVAALLIALWCVLIFDRLLSHLGGSLLNWGKCCGSCCTGKASNNNGSSG